MEQLQPYREAAGSGQDDWTKRRGNSLVLLFVVSGLLALVAALGLGARPTQAAPGGPGKSTAPAAPAVNGAYLQEGFEESVLGSSQFVAAVVTGSPTPGPSPTPGWDIVTTGGHGGGGHAVYAPDMVGVADQRLTMINPITIPANATSAVLSFWHHYSFDNGGWDGGVLEFTTDAGTSWHDVLSGTTFLTGGYNGTLQDHTPLGYRPAWINTVGNYSQVSVNLLPFAGHTVKLRWHLGTDLANGSGAVGWWMDDVQIVIQAPCGLGAWSDQAVLPTATGAMALVGHNGRLYSFGGITNHWTGGITNAYTYDPATHIWTSIASLPAPRYESGAVADGAYIYIVGGASNNTTVTNTLWRYDPASNSYTTLAPFTVPSAASAVVYLSGKIYRIGGQTTGGTFTTSVEVYTIATNSWTSLTAYPIPALGMAATGVGNYIYVAGGLTTGINTTAKTYRYDLANPGWNDVVLPDLPTVRSSAASGVLGEHWIVAGGSAGTGDITSTIGLNLTTNTWEALPSLPHGRYAPGGAAVGNAFYVVGGVIANNETTDDTQQYSETPCGTPTPTPCPLQFSDVDASNPFYTYVRCLACRNIVGGYSASPPCATAPCFLPGNSITRGQIAKFVSNAAGYSDFIPSSQQTFTDVPSSNPFWIYIERAVLHGVISGYSSSPPCTTGTPCFLPGNNVTRGQAAKFMSSAAGYSDAIPSSQQTFTDVPSSNPFWIYVERTAMHGIISGYTSSPPCAVAPCFLVGNNVTRGQTAKFIANTFYPNCQTP